MSRPVPRHRGRKEPTTHHSRLSLLMIQCQGLFRIFVWVLYIGLKYIQYTYIYIDMIPVLLN